MRTPKISVIMPIYNARQHLDELIAAIKKQTFEDYEVICVDDDSTDDSLRILQEIADGDGRFTILHQEHAGAGAARNYGFSVAKGEYVIFLDSNQRFAPDLLEKLYQAAVINRADIVACNYSRVSLSGKETRQSGIYTRWLPADVVVFSYRDCPDNIMRITSAVVWNKIYRRDFVQQHGLRFDELLTCNDVSFVAVSLATAERITYITDSLVRYRVPRSSSIKNLDDVYAAISSTVDQTHSLPHKDIIRNSLFKVVVENYIAALKKHIRDFTAPDAAKFYQTAHEAFNSGELSGLKPENLYNSELYREFCTVQKHDYETMKQLAGRRIIVSMTSYPRRIGTVDEVLDTIYSQTRKADEVLLWLAEEQFPGREADLPEKLRTLTADKRLTIRWCDDLKGHKKYFYALQEYTNDVVVTIDDDLLYPRDMLESLYKSYLLYPNAVSTLRAHLILVSEQKQILPYDAWIHETDRCIHQPCMQLMASGGAGDLYPPNLYRKEFFDRDVVERYCLWADNLWVKAMELVSDVPVVLVRPFETLRYLGDTQEETLYQINGLQNQYDTQLQKINEWLDETFERDILLRKLTETDIGEKICGVEAVSRHLDAERKANRWRKLIAERNLKETENRLGQCTDELTRAEKMLKQNEDKLKQLEDELRKTENELRQTQRKLRQTEESKPIGRQLKELEALLQSQKRTGSRKISLCAKYLLYYLAWIPEKILAAMMCCIRNGFVYTLKRGFKKLFRRG